MSRTSQCWIEAAGGRRARPRLSASARAGVVLDVDEADPRPLGGELGDELGAEPRGAAADEGHPAAQARVGGERLGVRASSAGTRTARPTAPRVSAA